MDILSVVIALAGIMHISIQHFVNKHNNKVNNGIQFHSGLLKIPGGWKIPNLKLPYFEVTEKYSEDTLAFVFNSLDSYKHKFDCYLFPKTTLNTRPFEEVEIKICQTEEEYKKSEYQIYSGDTPLLKSKLKIIPDHKKDIKIPKDYSFVCIKIKTKKEKLYELHGFKFVLEYKLGGLLRVFR
ncbi:hypothetical protein ASwh1_402 [Aeromonas phage Aswh_1]|nr:hypothetical protein ASwh1_402 [Aeromonas phage Aswh_1]